MKKAIVPIWISLTFSFLAVLLLITFYFIFLQGSRAPDVITTQESHSAVAHQVLLNYLSAPVMVQRETITYSDLIRIWYNDKTTYEDYLKKSTVDFIKQIDITELVDGKQKPRAIWFDIRETRTSTIKKQGDSLLRIGGSAGKSPRGSAETHLAVSETKSIVITVWNEATI